jgi:excisionase family DNA binding protein
MEVSVKEFAQLQGVSLQVIYRKIWEGRLDARRVDGQWRVKVNTAPGSEAVAAE